MTYSWLIPIAIVFIVVGLPVLLRSAENRRTFLLDMKKEERLIAEAKARELELEHKRRELEYREAVLELERFDRRMILDPPAAPDDEPGAADSGDDGPDPGDRPRRVR
jgi:hypothetical protein